MNPYHTFIALSVLFASPMLHAQNSPYILAVDEYVPAPGQFVNELPHYEPGDDAQAMALKCTEAIAQNAGGLITLGAWGGYVTFHFDHPVRNVIGQYDLYIAGNAITGSSEAGIVMVSCDENGNGLPDDTWYELSGSADTDSANVCYGYALTYTRTGEKQDIPWTDNQGAEGIVQRNAFHQQEYFPQWLDPSLTFHGTRLPDNKTDLSGNGSYFELQPFRYGYVDNHPNADSLANSFDISWAVDPDTRRPVSLSAIDFVRVYTALNQQAGWLGETSTELSNAIDLHPDVEASIRNISSNTEHTSHDLYGRRTSQQPGKYIIQDQRIIIINNQY